MVSVVVTEVTVGAYCYDSAERGHCWGTTVIWDHSIASVNLNTIVSFRVSMIQVQSSFEPWLPMKQPADGTARVVARRTPLKFPCTPFQSRYF